MAGDDQGHSCPYHDLTTRASEPFIGSMSFYTFNRILTGACAAFCVLVIAFHIANHAIHLSNTSQQIKIMRVCLLAPIYSVLSLLEVCFPVGNVYISPWLDVAQANCLAAYFMLICELISPEKEGQNHFFATIEIKGVKKGKGKPDGVEWFQGRWVGLFQYPVVALIVAIATCITEGLGVYCQYVSKVYYAHLWLSISQVMSPGLAFLSVIAVAVNLRKYMPHTKPMSKLIAVKLIVGLGFIQQIIFWALQSTKVLKPTAMLTYADKNIGIPALLSAVEMVPICLLVVWAYPVSPYHVNSRDSRESESYPQGPDSTQRSYLTGTAWVKACVSILSPAETIRGSIYAFQIITKQVPIGSAAYSAASPPSYGYQQQQEYAMGRQQGRR